METIGRRCCRSGLATLCKTASLTVAAQVRPTAFFPAALFRSALLPNLRSEFCPYPLAESWSGYLQQFERKNAVHDDKIGQRVDFINEKTGNWYFYYHFDDSTVDSALPAPRAFQVFLPLLRHARKKLS